MADPTNKIGESSENQDNIQTTYKVDSIAVCGIPPTTESYHKERGLSILITYMECLFTAKTALCETNIIMWPDYSCMEKGTNSAASCVGSVNSSTGGVSSTGLSSMLYSLVGAAAHMVTDNKNQRPM
jgi:hypothetical protein